ncbi:hypothetical protein H9L12_05480 [Sphingomonas rhizophila]|uniref:ATP-binding protein n=1 Tax=Sphingomonas rhizophila TaxID=2071607 RepID=A0A7G9SDN6_9SPHN|nr:hypothetical protein [Sphingomonas rhizophila]QNN65961.1 hypothetical protein H9L12_05480 [Sphingomonas rhizophila]
MTRAPDQIALPLDWPQHQDDSRFLVSDANRAAFEHFQRWTMWPVKATILTGPRRSGRTLLARGFCNRVGGKLIDQAEHQDEEMLFHAWNAAQESGRPSCWSPTVRRHFGNRDCRTFARAWRLPR